MGSNAWEDLREACGFSAEVAEGSKGQEAMRVNPHEVVVLRRQVFSLQDLQPWREVPEAVK